LPRSLLFDSQTCPVTSSLYLIDDYRYVTRVRLVDGVVVVRWSTQVPSRFSVSPDGRTIATCSDVIHHHQMVHQSTFDQRQPHGVGNEPRQSTTCLVVLYNVDDGTIARFVDIFNNGNCGRSLPGVLRPECQSPAGSRCDETWIVENVIQIGVSSLLIVHNMNRVSQVTIDDDGSVSGAQVCLSVSSQNLARNEHLV
jgi:hypothetical protein